MIYFFLFFSFHTHTHTHTHTNKKNQKMNSNDLNNDQLAQFYLERLRSCDKAWEELCSAQRQEIERLQKVAHDLRLQSSLQRASVAEEVGQYCIRLASCAGTNRIGNSVSSTQQQSNHQNNNNNGKNIFFTTNSNNSSSSRLLQNQQKHQRMIPLRAIIRFLNKYTDGMVLDQSFQGEKRLRADSAASPILQQQQPQQHESLPNLNNNGMANQNKIGHNNSRQNKFKFPSSVSVLKDYPEERAVQPQKAARHQPEYLSDDDEELVDDFAEEKFDYDLDDNNNNDGGGVGSQGITGVERNLHFDQQQQQIQNFNGPQQQFSLMMNNNNGNDDDDDNQFDENGNRINNFGGVVVGEEQQQNQQGEEFFDELDNNHSNFSGNYFHNNNNSNNHHGGNFFGATATGRHLHQQACPDD